MNTITNVSLIRTYYSLYSESLYQSPPLFYSLSSVKEEHKIAFFGEDVHIPLPSLVSTEVLFRPASNRTAVVVLMRDGRVVGHRAQLNSLKHLILEDVGEEHEGMYVIKNTEVPADVKHIILIVRGTVLLITVQLIHLQFF